VPNLPRVLLVDDDARLLTLLAMCLRGYDFAITTANNGVEALEQYRACCGNFSAIVTDVHMPQMDGLEFLRTVRAQGYKGRLVLISGHVSSDELKAFAELSIGGFFQKPFEVRLLATMLRPAPQG
jgi:CheY-like chemotaxis protein